MVKGYELSGVTEFSVSGEISLGYTPAVLREPAQMMANEVSSRVKARQARGPAPAPRDVLSMIIAAPPVFAKIVGT
jgi:hypothetical protein